jgi:hypothetical protein
VACLCEQIHYVLMTNCICAVLPFELPSRVPLFTYNQKAETNSHVELTSGPLLHKHEVLGGAACECRHLHGQRNFML